MFYQRTNTHNSRWFIKNFNICFNIQLSEDYNVVYGDVEGEVTVGGVFLRLFISQPSWVLRKPREFMVAILERYTDLIQSTAPNVSININW